MLELLEDHLVLNEMMVIILLSQLLLLLQAVVVEVQAHTLEEDVLWRLVMMEDQEEALVKAKLQDHHLQDLVDLVMQEVLIL